MKKKNNFAKKTELNHLKLSLIFSVMFNVKFFFVEIRTLPYFGLKSVSFDQNLTCVKDPIYNSNPSFHLINKLRATLKVVMSFFLNSTGDPF